jgi:hypothetical protein
MALVAARWRAVSNLLLPLAVASNAVPIVALAPLTIVWFGIGEGSKIAIVTILCFFPTLVNTVQGLQAAPLEEAKGHDDNKRREPDVVPVRALDERRYGCSSRLPSTRLANSMRSTWNVLAEDCGRGCAPARLRP